MADSKLETVIDAIATRLATITTANGYETEIGAKVFEWLPMELQAADLPSVSVQHPVVEVVRSPSSVWRHKPQVVVVAMNSSGTNSIVQARKAAADIVKAVGVDRTFGGIVFDCDFNQMEFAIEQKDKIIAAVKISFTVTFQTTQFNSYA